MDLLARQRKYYLALFILVIATAMVFLDKLSGDQWVTVALFDLGLYAGGNVAAKYAKENSNASNS